MWRAAGDESLNPHRSSLTMPPYRPSCRQSESEDEGRGPGTPSGFPRRHQRRRWTGGGIQKPGLSSGPGHPAPGGSFPRAPSSHPP